MGSAYRREIHRNRAPGRPSVCPSEGSCSSSDSVVKPGCQRLGVFVHSIHAVASNPDISIFVSRGTFLDFLGDALINACTWSMSVSNDVELNEKFAAALLGADRRGATSIALHVVGPCSDTYASLESVARAFESTSRLLTSTMVFITLCPWLK